MQVAENSFVLRHKGFMLSEYYYNSRVIRFLWKTFISVVFDVIWKDLQLLAQPDVPEHLPTSAW